MTRYEHGFLNKIAEIKKADSLSDDELKAIADYYNKNRKDRLNMSGDIGRYLLTAGSLPAVMMYDYNRSGGTQLMGSTPKSLTLRRHTKKEVDANNAVLKGMITAIGGVAGGYMGNSYSDWNKGRNTAIGVGAGAGGAFLLMHLMQKLGQIRARKMLKKIKEQDAQ